MNEIIGNNPADKHLVDRVLRGDTQAFGVVVKNTEGLVAQIVFKMVPVAEDRKDIAQDVYLKAFHKLSSFKFQSKLSTWIAQIAYNACLTWIEKKKPMLPGNLHQNHSEDYTSGGADQDFFDHEPEKRLSQKELGAILSHEIQNLPVIYQTLITLYHNESFSYEELSQITGLPGGTVKSYLFRARKMLRDNLLSKYKKEAL